MDSSVVYSQFNLSVVLQTQVTTEFVVGALIGIAILIVLSGLFSASENSFFSITKQDKIDLAASNSVKDQAVLNQLAKPKELLATILIANNFVNVSLVILSSLLFERSFHFPSPWDFIIQVVLVTFILLLFGEVIPKVYATTNNVKVARLMAKPLFMAKKLLYPLVYSLVKSTNGINKRIKIVNQSVSIEELNHAIDITSSDDSPDEEKGILKGIVNYGNISASQIMKARMDVVALDIKMNFEEVMDVVKVSGFSRLPVYKENIDDIEGVIFVKDLLKYLNQDNSFIWSKLIKEVKFIPENKKIDDLLDEFREIKVHLAIVVDEYGGTSGLVTMEDILEEIFGEINDEFDINSHLYSVLDENTYLMNGKLMQNDACKLFDLPLTYFDEVKGDSDTIGGLIQELAGSIPKINEILTFEDVTFKIESADDRKINRVKVHYQKEEEYEG